MKVVLLENIPGLGRIDDIKEVSEGYARNFLFPKHLAVQSSSAIMSKLSQRQERASADAEADLSRQQRLAESLDGLEITLTEKTNDQGVLYAAIPAQKVIDELKRRGYAVHKKELRLPSIKSTGESIAWVKLSHGLEVKIKIVVNSIG